MQHDYGTSSLSQIVLSESIRSGRYQEYLPWLRKKLIFRRNYMMDILDLYFSDIATWEKPTGSFFIYLTLKHNVHMEKVFQQALEKNILISPGYLYNFNGRPNIRLSYAYASFSEMERGLPQLAEIIAANILKPKTT